MRILSFDPGAVAVGLSFREGKKLLRTGHLRLIPKDTTYPQFKKKYGNKAEGLLVRNLRKFVGGSDWTELFLKTEVCLLESNTFPFSIAVSYALVSWLQEFNPDCVQVFVHPFAISKHFGIGGLSRLGRKARIRELVFQRLSSLSELWDSGEISQDEIDSVCNIFYFLERNQQKKVLLPQCPSWSCNSLNLANS